MTKPENLAEAMLCIQRDLPGVVKDASNPHFKNKYASLAAVIATVKPVAQKYGVFVMQTPGEYRDGVMTVNTEVVHVGSGDRANFTAQAPVGKQDPQGAMAAVTYLSRYSYLGVFSLPSLDDDAESAIVNTEDLIKSLKLCSTPEELNQWGNDMAPTILDARGNKAELKREYSKHMEYLKQAQEGCTDE